MNKTNMALLGFVSSAADYLKNRAGGDDEVIKDLADIDFEKLKKELENSSYFADEKGGDEELIRTGKEAFDRFFKGYKGSGLINEFDELFNVDFGNREKDMEMQDHLLKLLKDPSKEESPEFNRIAEAVYGQSAPVTENRNEHKIPSADNKQMDDIFDEILDSEKTARENKAEEDDVIVEDAPEPEVTAVKEEVKQEAEEAPADKKTENYRRLSELLHSFVNQDYGFEQEDMDRLFAEIDLSEIKKEREEKLKAAKAGRSLSNILRDVKNEEKPQRDNEYAETESQVKETAEEIVREVTERTTLEEVQENTSENKTLSDSLREIREGIPAVPSVFGIGYEPSEIQETVNVSDVYEPLYIMNPGSDMVEDEPEEEPVIEEPAAETVVTEETVADEPVKEAVAEEAPVFEEIALPEENQAVNENIPETKEEEQGIEIDIDELFGEVAQDNETVETRAEEIAKVKEEAVEEKKEVREDGEIFLDIEKILEEYDAESGSKENRPAIMNTESRPEDSPEGTDDDLTDQLAQEVLSEDSGKEEKPAEAAVSAEDKKETDILDELLENLAREAGRNDINEDTEKVAELADIEEEIPQPHYILNPGTETEDKEETEPIEEEEEADPLDGLLDGLNSEVIAERIEEARLREEEEKVNIYDAIKAIYPYLSDAFVRAVYDLKGSLAYDYPEDVEIIILHRLRFADIEGLHNFVEVIIGHGYAVNVDEKKMIVDVFKSHINADGRILTDIFEIANQARLLSGEYEGYKVIVVNEED